MLVLRLFVVFLSCNQKVTSQKKQTEIKFEQKDTIIHDLDYYEFNYDSLPKFDRSEIKKNLHQKIKNNQPLIVHILVPLCDNENQAIVPVHNSLGNGMNLRTNLYWGAGYGIKTHFKRLRAWKLLKQIPNKDSVVLERLIFKKKYPNGTNVIFVADAYRSDKMIQCLTDYFNALSGVGNDTIQADSVKYDLRHSSDLVIFNGHNGLMENYIEYIPPASERPRDAAAMACASYDYFNPRLIALKAYPFLMTQELLPPEAYIAEALVDNWTFIKSPEQTLNAGGDAVAKIHKKT